MNYDEFAKQYKIHRRPLERDLAELKDLLERGIVKLEREREHKGVPHEMFRIRLKEARVKDCGQLYSKIEGDQSLEFAKAFESGHVRDLLGARLVCHNLSDVIAVAKTLMKGRWGDLHYVLPDKEEKKWLEKPQEQSGYRGWHVDVRWRRKGSTESEDYCHAELQIRTLLQDAWATFMHDDVYKKKAQLMLPDELFYQFRDMSNILYALDTMAQRIREGVEGAKLLTNSDIPMQEAIEAAMFASAAYSKLQSRIPAYQEVARSDRYLVDGDNAHFFFEIKAKCASQRTFSFPITGDTPNDRMSSLVVRRQTRSGWETITHPVLKVIKSMDSPHAIIVEDARSSKTHAYQIACVWGGVFCRDLEYVWGPWASTYHGVMKSYSLSVSFKKVPKVEPQLFRVSDYKSIRDIITAQKRNTGLRAVRQDNDGVACFSFDVENPNDNFLCLFSR